MQFIRISIELLVFMHVLFWAPGVVEEWCKEGQFYFECGDISGSSLVGQTNGSRHIH